MAQKSLQTLNQLAINCSSSFTQTPQTTALDSSLPIPSLTLMMEAVPETLTHLKGQQMSPLPAVLAIMKRPQKDLEASSHPPPP